MHRKSITLRFPKWLDDEIMTICDALGVSKNAFISMLIAEEVAKRKKRASREEKHKDPEH